MTGTGDIRSAFATASSALVSDALDGLGLREHTLDRAIRPLDPGAALVGLAVPVIVRSTEVIPDEPYRGEMAVLDSLRPGEVPVYAVEPGVEAALWGELFSCAAIGRGAVGAVVDGLIRDAALIRELGFPVFGRGFSPLDTQGRAEVVAWREPAVCVGVSVHPGDLVVADEDGIVVCPAAAAAEVAAACAAKLRDEVGARADLKAGASIFEVWERWRAL
jgi:regulator of RNase E activity RraA